MVAAKHGGDAGDGGSGRRQEDVRVDDACHDGVCL